MDTIKLSDLTQDEQNRLKETIIRAILHGKHDKPKESREGGIDYGTHDRRSND